MKNLNNKFVQVNLYIIFGVLTTLINILAYEMINFLGVDYRLSNTIAFIVSVILAYITNKIYVFKSNTPGVNKLIKEIIRFASSRIFTYLLELLILIIFIDGININKSISKWVATGVVVVLNYFLSKNKVFRNDEE